MSETPISIATKRRPARPPEAVSGDRQQRCLLFAFPSSAAPRPLPVAPVSVATATPQQRRKWRFSTPSKTPLQSPLLTPMPEGEICFLMSLQGRRLGWINGTPPELRHPLALWLLSDGGKLTVGPVPGHIGNRDAIRGAYQAYVDANHAAILDRIPIARPQIRFIERSGKSVIQARAFYPHIGRSVVVSIIFQGEQITVSTVNRRLHGHLEIQRHFEIWALKKYSPHPLFRERAARAGR